MHFPSVVKGRIAETILTTLLERAGYRVTPLGVETLLDEVNHLDAEQYRALELPAQFRSLPDLLVATAEVDRAYLIEVKFRRRFDVEVARELRNTLCRQREHWRPAYAALMLSEPIMTDGRFHQDYIRVAPLETIPAVFDQWLARPDIEDQVRSRALWESLPQLQHIFRYFFQSDDNLERGGRGQRDADFVVSALRDLRNLG